jgi:hypothetical protein
MEFLILLVLVGVAYLIWRISDQLPDLIFRVSEIQRDLAEIRRRLADGSAPPSPSTSSDAPTRVAEDRSV